MDTFIDKSLETFISLFFDTREMNFWLVIVIYAAIGICSTVIVYGKLQTEASKLVISSFIFTIFFSFSIAFGRMPLPLPTPIVLAAWILDIRNPLPCIPTSEGCAPANEGGAFILLPFIVQWIFWCGVFVSIRAGSRIICRNNA